MHLSEHEVLEALAEPVCAVCDLAARAGRAYLAGVIEGGINDPETRYLAAIEALPEPRLFAALAAGKGFLCLNHLARLPEGKKKARFRARLEEILADLEVFQRKHDYRFAKEPMGRERDAWLRAVRALGGAV